MTKYLSVILIAATIISCSQSPGGNRQAELDALKKQQAELKTKIATLEEEIAKSDTAKSNEKSKSVLATEMMPQTFTLESRNNSAARALSSIGSRSGMSTNTKPV